MVVEEKATQRRPTNRKIEAAGAALTNGRTTESVLKQFLNSS